MLIITNKSNISYWILHVSGVKIYQDTAIWISTVTNLVKSSEKLVKFKYPFENTKGVNLNESSTGSQKR